MSVLHLRDSSVGSPQRAWIARKKEREIDIGKEEGGREGGRYTLSC